MFEIDIETSCQCLQFLISKSQRRLGLKIETVKTFTNGDRLEGTWTNDKFANGKGAYTFASGGLYVGDFINGKFSGKGIKSWPSGGYYDGEFKDDKRTKGMYIWPSAR